MTESAERYYIPAQEVPLPVSYRSVTRVPRAKFRKAQEQPRGTVVVLSTRCPLARFASRELMAVNDS